jgi:quinol monooxygenase YgiN
MLTKPAPIVVVRVALRIKPEMLESFQLQAEQESREVPQRFEGCDRYAFYQQVEDAEAFLLYEEWSSRESFQAYQSSDYFESLGSRLRPMLSARPDSAYYIAERVGP